MPDERLERVANAIADGAEIDWAQEESSAEPQDRALLQQLRIVAGVAAAAEGPRPGETWGQLRLTALIGSGAHGDVFRAHDPRLKRDVALKLLRETGTASEVVAEGHILAKVRHRGIVTIHGADQIDGRAGLWMELIEGRTLEEILREQGPWDAKSAALVGAELCAALAEVHGAGLVHRDVKAQNVMREPGGRIVLMDFGVGRALAELERRPAGTPLYMAPELLAGEHASPRSDLYSLGVLLFHLVTGEYPVRAESVEKLKQVHATRSRRFLRDARPNLPNQFVQVVERALEPEPERRLATAGEMEQALLETLRSGEKPSARHASRSARLLAGLGAGALGALLALVFLPVREGSRSEPDASIEAAKPTTLLPTPSPSLSSSDVRPAADPFVAPLGTPSNETQGTTADAPYAIDARFDGSELRIRPSAPLSLYVFALDETDRPLLAFPVPGKTSENPLVPGQETRVRVAVPFPRPRLVAVATPARLADFESEVARQRVPSGTSAVPLSEAALERLAAALGFAPRATGRFLAGAPPLAGHVEMLRGVWIRRVER